LQFGSIIVQTFEYESLIVFVNTIILYFAYFVSRVKSILVPYHLLFP
jgi:hypothetical protein